MEGVSKADLRNTVRRSRSDQVTAQLAVDDGGCRHLTRDRPLTASSTGPHRTHVAVGDLNAGTQVRSRVSEGLVPLNRCMSILTGVE